MLTKPHPLTHYQTIAQNATAEYKDRGSRFIAYVFPVENIDEFKFKLQEIKKEHPKAVHHCFAYRIGYEGLIFRANDDGEPSGSAGKPILGQIDSKLITNTAIVVVRYFGGSLLGIPGLIQAYKTASALALQTVPAIRKPILEEYKLQFDYQSLNDVMRILKSCDCVVKKQEAGLFYDVVVSIPKFRLDEALFKIKECRNVDISKILPGKDK